MPELPEVNRVMNIIKRAGLGRTIEKVASTEDTIIFSGGITNTDFEEEIKGRRITNVGRHGKVFYLTLDGEGRHPVMHLGMTGNLYVRGADPAFYKSSPKVVDPAIWPPKFWKFIITLSAAEGETPSELVFVDPRRLGRIRLCQEPLNEPPISELAADPITGMISPEDFVERVRKKSCTIKSMLLDQKDVVAGVGNWIADEVLFHARIHPEQKPNLLSPEELRNLHEKILYVCETAVSVDADASQFPEGWLFKHRWGKGKKKESDLLLPSGEKAQIKWITVGSRTSAFVPKVQRLRKRATDDGNVEMPETSSELSEPPKEDPEQIEEPSIPVAVVKPAKTRRRLTKSKFFTESGDTARPIEDAFVDKEALNGPGPVSKRRRGGPSSKTEVEGSSGAKPKVGEIPISGARAARKRRAQDSEPEVVSAGGNGLRRSTRRKS